MIRAPFATIQQTRRFSSVIRYNTIRYDTIQYIYVLSKADAIWPA